MKYFRKCFRENYFLRKCRRGKNCSRAEATIFLFFDLRRFRSRFSHAPPHFVAMWKLLDGRRVDVFTSLNHNVHVKISCLLRNDLKLQHFENWIFQSQIQFLVKLWTFWKFEKFFKYLKIENQKSLKNYQNLKILTSNLKKNSLKMKLCNMLKDFSFLWTKL